MTSPLYIPSGPAWHHATNPALGEVVIEWSETIAQIEARNPEALTRVRDGPLMFVGSDYSGQHSSGRFEVFSFLVADLAASTRWEVLRRQVRSRFLRDGRRMSFKDLRDHRRRDALWPFLQAANHVPGVCVTFAIEKGVNLFSIGRVLEMSSPSLKPYSHWSAKTFGRLLTTVHLVSFLVRGLSGPGQSLMWITDEDDIAPNDSRLVELSKIASNVMSHYLPHDLGRVHVGTTASDNGTCEIEDMVSIADLTAGATSELLSKQCDEGSMPSRLVLVPAPKQVSLKTRAIVGWLAQREWPLKRVLAVVTEQGGLNTKWVQFLTEDELAGGPLV